ncbi:hypothetical protein JHK82_040870 [Glycine max]|nr:hypothetical protein JHK82_040870 [Glycine max]
MSIYLSRSFPRSNSSLFLCSGKALQSEVLRLGEEMFLVDAGPGTPRICMQDEPTGVPINRATRFENKVGSLDLVAGESLIKKKILERFFIDLVAGESLIKERAAARFNDLVGSTDVVAGEPLLLLPRRFRQNLAWMELNKIWRTNTKADKAATKAMPVNRVGDFGLAPGISGRFTLFQTVDFSTIFARASAPRNSWISCNMRLNAITLICILLLIGAVGKSAQIGSHTWSPDAMEGSVIHAMSDEQDMRKMGGLASSFPFTYAMMLMGSLSLIGFPFLTGFYSKDVILELAYTKYTISGNFAFWLGSVSVLFTSYYSFRSLFLTFLVPTNSFGRDILRCHDAPIPMAIPLILLALGSLFVGYLAKV